MGSPCLRMQGGGGAGLGPACVALSVTLWALVVLVGDQGLPPGYRSHSGRQRVAPAPGAALVLSAGIQGTEAVFAAWPPQAEGLTVIAASHGALALWAPG